MPVSTMTGADKDCFMAKMDYLPQDFFGRRSQLCCDAVIEDRFCDVPETTWTELWDRYQGTGVRIVTRQALACPLDREMIFLKLPASRLRIITAEREASRTDV